jgi:hypothetical protein
MIDLGQAKRRIILYLSARGFDQASLAVGSTAEDFTADFTDVRL